MFGALTSTPSSVEPVRSTDVDMQSDRDEISSPRQRERGDTERVVYDQGPGVPLNDGDVYMAQPVVRAWAMDTGSGTAGQPREVTWGPGASSVMVQGKQVFVPFLMSTLLRLRVERDVFAKGPRQSACVMHGCERWRSWSTFVGWYFSGSDVTVIKQTLATAKLHNAVGVFVVPRCEGVEWFEKIWTRAWLRISVPVYEVIGSTGQACLVTEMVALVVSFGYIGRVKAKRRQEKDFTVYPIAALEEGGIRKIPAIAVLQARCSPMPQAYMPSVEADTMPDAGPFVVPPGVVPPAAKASIWNQNVMKEWASEYPFQDVANLAVQAIGEGVVPFVGIREKSVLPGRTPGMPEEVALLCREQFMKDVEQGFSAGPYPAVPYKWARLCSWFWVPKDKYNPSDKRVRLISNFSRGDAASVNGLSWSPKLIGRHIGPHTIRARIAECGAGALVNAWDVPACFKRILLHPEIAHMFVYRVLSVQYGEEYFADRTNPFGYTPSEWEWQCVLAVLMWKFRRSGFGDFLDYVDNFFDIMPPGTEMVERGKRIEAIFAEAGCPLHEPQHGTVFTGLGWEFDTERMVMVCPEKKVQRFRDLLSRWADGTALTLTELKQAAGLMLCLSAGFPIGRASVAYVTVVHNRTRGDVQCAAQDGNPKTFIVPLSKESTAALQFWSNGMCGWDRTCPKVADFSPQAGAEVLGASDAATDAKAGGGGWLLPVHTTSAVGYMRAWTQSERDRAKVDVRESTTVLEAEALYELLHRGKELIRGKRVEIHLDNAAVVWAVQGLYSARPVVMGVIERIAKLCCRWHVVLRVRHVVGKLFNTIADCLSHMDAVQAKVICRDVLGVNLSFSFQR